MSTFCIISPIALALLLFGAAVSSASEHKPKCEKVTPVGDIDLTKGERKWHYCLTSQVGRDSDYCTNTLSHAKGKEETTNAKLNYYDLKTKEAKSEDFVMAMTNPGTYVYPGRESVGYITELSPDQECASYYKCYNSKGNWNVQEKAGDFVLLLCRKPELCDKYPEQIEKLRATRLLNGTQVTLEKFDQETCKSLNLV